jgi:hypothetical protein
VTRSRAADTRARYPRRVTRGHRDELRTSVAPGSTMRTLPPAVLFPVFALLVASLGCERPSALDLRADAAAGGTRVPAVLSSDANLSFALQVDAATPEQSALMPPPSADPPGAEPVPTAVVSGDWRPPVFCHDLAPAAGTVEAAFFAGICPSALELHGGRIADGIYRAVRPEICLSTPGTFETQPARIRISDGGKWLDWSADRPIFSAWIDTAGVTLAVTETCRLTDSGNRPQPRYEQQFSVSGDELTLYTGLSSLVFRRER